MNSLPGHYLFAWDLFSSKHLIFLINLADGLVQLLSIIHDCVFGSRYYGLAYSAFQIDR